MKDNHSKLLTILRQRHNRSREQIARKLGVTETVVYNWETGRSRMKLSDFIRLLNLFHINFQDLINRHIFAIEGLSENTEPHIVSHFRSRLKLSQKQLAQKLNYSSRSMVHHFEKGLRSPDLKVLIDLMTLSDDDVQGFIFELTQDQTFSQNFPKGQKAQFEDWKEYWSRHYISGMRQIMRTDLYQSLIKVPKGFFCPYLDISLLEEEVALQMMKKLKLIRWNKSKYIINKDVKILLPKDVKQEILNQYKFAWLTFGKNKYQKDQVNSIVSTNLLPFNRELYDQFVRKIRELENELHNFELENTNGFIHASFVMNFTEVNK